MKLAETVTFGGSALNRAAEIRGDTGAIAALLADTTTRVIALWRGKPLVQQFSAPNSEAPPATVPPSEDHTTQLVRLSANHPIFQHAKEPALFLGREQGGAVFAHDISDWQPAALDASRLDSFMDQTVQHHPDLPADHSFVELRAIMTQLNARDAELAATARALFSWHQSHQFCAKCGAKSTIAMSGWQRDCADCDGHHFPRTDPVVIMLITKGNNVLMGRSPGWPEGMYSLLAGFIEPGETIEAAVRREVFEEAGIRVGEVSYLASQPWPFPASLMMGCKGDALSTEITIDPVEIEDAQWFSREEIMLAFSGQHPVLKPARPGAIAHFLLRNWLADCLE